MEGLSPKTPEIPPVPEAGKIPEAPRPAVSETLPPLPPLPPVPTAPVAAEQLPPLPKASSAPVGPGPELTAPQLTPEEVKKAQRSSIGQSLRWLSIWWQRQAQKLTGAAPERKGLDLAFLEVRVPRESEIKTQAAEAIFASLAHLYRGGLLGVQPVFSFEIVADAQHIHFFVAVPRPYFSLVEKQIHAAYPTATVEEVPEYDIFKKEGYVSYAQLATSGPKYYSLKTYGEFDEKTDPLNTLLSSMTKLGPEEAAVVQISISPAGTAWQKQGQSFIARAKALEKQEEKRKVPLSKEVEEGVMRKVGKPGHYALVRVVAVSPEPANSQMHLQDILAALHQLSSPHLSSFVPKRILNRQHFAVDFIYRHVPRFAHWTVLSSEELATLYHLPHKEITVPNVRFLEAKTGVAPLELPESGLYLGTTTYQGVDRKVFLQRDDRRRHTYIIGQTGTGKSEFAKFLAYQDIKAGEGVCFIDPHGDAVEDLLKMIPDERIDDVIYFDPGDLDRPPGINILEAETEEGKHLAVNAFISLLYKLYDPNRTGILGPVLERAVRNVMLTAMSEKGNTLIEVFRLLTDPTFAEAKIPLIQDPIVKRYWTDELARTSDFHKSEQLGYFVSKFDRFVTERLMRNIIGQGQSAFNFREVMDSRKILLVNLSKGKIGEENSNFLGLILVPRILTAAMSRVDTPESQRPDFYLYVDEFQNFATPDFVQILSEARKYRLNLTVANQFISQLDEAIKNAVFGNVGTSAFFRVGVDDANYLETQVAPYFTKADLANAATGQAYIKLLINGVPSIPFGMKTDWPAIQALPRNPEKAAKIKEISRLKYARAVSDVEAEITRRAGL